MSTGQFFPAYQPPAAGGGKGGGRKVPHPPVDPNIVVLHAQVHEALGRLTELASGVERHIQYTKTLAEEVVALKKRVEALEDRFREHGHSNDLGLGSCWDGT